MHKGSNHQKRGVKEVTRFFRRTGACQSSFSIALLLLFLTRPVVIGWRPVAQNGCLEQSICHILVSWFPVDHVGAVPTVLS